MKNQKANGGISSSGRQIVCRVTDEQMARLEEESSVTGLSKSEIVRRRIFGGRPIVANSDTKVILELRRIGGLLKHHFTAMRDTASPTLYDEHRNAYNELVHLLELIRFKLS